MERRRRREWDEHLPRMDAERLVKTSRDNIPAGEKISRTSEKKMERLNPLLELEESPTTKGEDICFQQNPHNVHLSVITARQLYFRINNLKPTQVSNQLRVKLCYL